VTIQKQYTNYLTDGKGGRASKGQDVKKNTNLLRKKSNLGEGCQKDLRTKGGIKVARKKLNWNRKRGSTF